MFATAQSLLGLGKKGKEFDILKDFRGLLRPGEMCLVLGRPGSGCTSFLKVISNQRFGYTHVGGKVLYGPFEADFFEKRYRGEAVYCEEDENHHPTLTVGQTLDFALETKVPGKRPAGLSRQAFKDKVIDMMLKMFNIEHTRNTIVGNPFVRGVSGGERKRVSIAETMITGASLMSWDNSVSCNDDCAFGIQTNAISRLEVSMPPLLSIMHALCALLPTSTRQLHSSRFTKLQRTFTNASIKFWLLTVAARSTLALLIKREHISRASDSSRSPVRPLLTI